MIFDELQELGRTAVEEEQAAEHRINVCVAAGCVSSGSDHLLQQLKEEVAARGLEGKVLVKGVGCMGPCAGGPVVRVASEDILYQNVQPEDARSIMDQLGKGPIERLAVPTDRPFFKRQEQVVTQNCGVIDPERLDDAVAHGAYSALAKVLSEMTSLEVIDQVIRSGLRGRGGAGYPTGLKWSTVAKAGGEKKYIVCNADEGDPGAFMDRSVLESDPHRVLEGMAIAAVATDAQEGIIYIRAEYPLAIDRLKKAIRQAERAGVLGKNVLGAMHEFHVQIRLGAGAFVCGEETALLASIEGKRGSPRPRPPYPAESGLWGKSTLINNVETFANIPAIISNGADWFAGIGTEKSKGTKVFALAGKVQNTGLIEVPMGTPLRDIVFEIGGGIPDGHSFKAVQTGGPSGGCISAENLDSPVDYESLAELGSIMGSGGIIVLDETSSMVDVARYFMDFSMDESCGKCVPCRVGTVQLHELLEKFLRREAGPRDMKLLEELCDTMQTCSLCGLGQAAPNPVLSTLRYFRNEYEELMAGEPAAAAGEEGES